MIEELFIIMIIFVAYVIYVIVSEQKAASHSPTSQAEFEKPVAVVKQSTPQPALKNTKEAEVKATAVADGKSMSELVGTTAGTIWKYLDKHGPITVAKLVRELQEEEKTIQRSIGWLAQENKITLDIIDRAETISLK